MSYSCSSKSEIKRRWKVFLENRGTSTNRAAVVLAYRYGYADTEAFKAEACDMETFCLKLQGRKFQTDREVIKEFLE